MNRSPVYLHAEIFEELVALGAAGAPHVLVVLVEALGSTPQDTGAKMIVTPTGLHRGTVGGGRVEAKALELAAEMIALGERSPRFVNWTLKTDVGMTCGGSVKLYLEPHLPARVWPIAIFGAGHIAQALVPVLAPLPCALTVCDSREEWLGRLPAGRNIRAVHRERPEELIAELPPGAFILCMTRGHTSDRPILERALQPARSFPYIGVIGSEAKASVLRRELVGAGVSPERAESFHCPVGLPFGTNHPHEIALSVAAQLLLERDRVYGGSSWQQPAAISERPEEQAAPPRLHSPDPA